MIIAWAKKVDQAFLARVVGICNQLNIHPSDLMTCMAFETARTFSPSIRNAAGSSAVGLIQFMPSTAAAMGTTTEALMRMAPLTQLEFVS